MTLLKFLQESYNTVPFFTRYWLTASIVVSCLGRFELISLQNLTLNYYEIFYKCHIWRPLTALLYYKHDFSYLINMFMVYSYSSKLETGIFAGKPADYLYMLLFGWFGCTFCALFMKLSLLLDSMVIMVVYVWCVLNKDVVVRFLFGTKFKAMYLPWIILLLHFIVKGRFLNNLVGIFIGHIAFFLVFKYPQEFGGPSLLTPPDFLRKIFPDYRIMGTASGDGNSVAGGPAGGVNTIGQHRWGRGHRLHDD